MRKLVSLILAVVMICSMAVTAFATTTDNHASFEIREATDNYTANAATMDSSKTELWLQVDAQGQIDVTVPLVLVFKTDIDGGVATTGSNYGITNNSSADLVVTKIVTAAEAKTNDQPMTLTAFTASTPSEDHYMVKLTPAAGTAFGTFPDGYTNPNEYDLNTATHENAALKGGLFELKKATDAGVGTKTDITATMKTGKLSFVTKRTDADVLDTTMGVKLLTVTYTVAIDTNDAIGSTITTTPNNPATNG